MCYNLSISTEFRYPIHEGDGNEQARNDRKNDRNAKAISRV